MDERVAAAWAVLPDYLGQHIVLSAAALVLGLALSVPLALVAVRSPRVRWPVMLVASLVQTIPGLALLALFYPLLLAVSALSERLFATGFSALGFLPSLLALALYSMLPVLRNGVTGILTLDPAIIEAARGVGMTGWQRLWRVEVPLAAPMWMAGVRTSAVWVIGAATLSTPVGQTSLGNYIFSGLQVQNWIAVLFGCVSAAGLALLVDQLLALVENGIAQRRIGRVVLALLCLGGGVLAAAIATGEKAGGGYVVGAKSFTEQYILSALMAARIEAEGAPVTRRVGLGSSIAFTALENGEIDAYVDYSGTIWANVMRRTDAPPRQDILSEAGNWLRREHGVTLLGALGFENAYALAMRRDRALALGIRTIADLARVAPQLRMGGDFEFFGRPEWTSLSERYGLAFASRRQFQSTFMYSAVVDGEVDVISAFSSDGRIVADDLVVLEDPLGAILPYDAIVLLAPGRGDDPLLRRALEPLLNAIQVESMREASYRVDREQDKSSAIAAAHWLEGKIGLSAP